jgi:hypothetical protein
MRPTTSSRRAGRTTNSSPSSDSWRPIEPTSSATLEGAAVVLEVAAVGGPVQFVLELVGRE